MSKTTLSISGRRFKLEVVLTQAILEEVLGVTAPATPATIDISSIAVSIEENQAVSRELITDYVFGSIEPIIDVDDVIAAQTYTVTIMYTQGKEQFGTGNWDFHRDILQKLVLERPALTFPHIWSPAGGAVGDEEFLTDATETYLMMVGKPVSSSSGEKIKVTYQIAATGVTSALAT